MTEAGWTRATDVTQPGWYWLRRVGSLTVVQVIAVPGYEQRHWIVEGVNLRWSLGNIDGEFLGPLSPDSYQQGRVEGAQKALEIVKGHNANGEHQVVVYDLQQLVIEQAAQAEKGVGDANG